MQLRQKDKPKGCHLHTDVSWTNRLCRCMIYRRTLLSAGISRLMTVKRSAVGGNCATNLLYDCFTTLSVWTHCHRSACYSAIDPVLTGDSRPCDSINIQI